MTTTLTRADIQKISNDPKVIRALETFFATVADTAQAVAANVEATTGINAATVVTLSPNDVFENERVLEVVPPIALQDGGPGGSIVLGLNFPLVVNGGYALTINLLADTDVTIPSGTMVTQESFGSLGNYANDAGASAGGVPVGGLYRNGSVLMVRVA